MDSAWIGKKEGITMSHVFDPTEFLKSKERYVREELLKDFPLLALSSPEGVYVTTRSVSRSHQKVTKLVINPPATVLVLAGFGNSSDFGVLRAEVRQSVSAYERLVSSNDLSWRLIAPTVTDILRSYFESLEKAKALSVHVLLVDPLDYEYPFCAISFRGEFLAGTNFLIDDKGPRELPVTFRSFKEMMAYARATLKRKRGYFHQSFSFKKKKKYSV